MVAVINQVFFVVFLISLLLLGIKYFQKASYQKVERRRISSFKWLLWFSKYDIYSTTSNDYRKYMKNSNGLSIAFWASVFLSLITLFLIVYTRSRA